MILEVFTIAKQNDNVLINEQIKFEEMMVIGPNGEKMYAKDYGYRAWRFWVGPGPEPKIAD